MTSSITITLKCSHLGNVAMMASIELKKLSYDGVRAVMSNAVS